MGRNSPCDRQKPVDGGKKEEKRANSAREVAAGEWQRSSAEKQLERREPKKNHLVGFSNNLIVSTEELLSVEKETQRKKYHTSCLEQHKTSGFDYNNDSFIPFILTFKSQTILN